jgi:hypothetical protein
MLAAADIEYRNRITRYDYCRTGWDLGEQFALDVQAWYFLGRDIFPLIAAYQLQADKFK